VQNEMTIVCDEKREVLKLIDIELFAQFAVGYVEQLAQFQTYTSTTYIASRGAVANIRDCTLIGDSQSQRFGDEKF
jgi:hypothetical protein